MMYLGTSGKLQGIRQIAFPFIPCQELHRVTQSGDPVYFAQSSTSSPQDSARKTAGAQ